MASKTLPLPSMEDGHDSELTEVALDYVMKRDKRMAAGKEEKQAKNILIGTMDKKNMKRYHDDDANLTVVIEEDISVKVTLGGDDDDDD